MDTVSRGAQVELPAHWALGRLVPIGVIVLAIVACGGGGGPGATAQWTPDPSMTVQEQAIACAKTMGVQLPANYDVKTDARHLIPVTVQMRCSGLINAHPMTQEQQTQYREFVVCLRNSGIPTEDPTFESRAPVVHIRLGAGVDRGSMTFKNAAKACADKTLPSGADYP